MTRVFSLELKRRMLDASAVITSFVAPFMLASILGLTFGHAETQGLVRIGVVECSPATQGKIVRSGITAAALPDAITIDKYATEAKLRTALGAGFLDAGLVVPPGFGTLTSAGPAGAKTPGKSSARSTNRACPDFPVAGTSVHTAAHRAPARATHGAAPTTTPSPSPLGTGTPATMLRGLLALVIGGNGGGPDSQNVEVLSSKTSSVGTLVAEGIAEAIESRVFTGAFVAYEVTGKLPTTPHDRAENAAIAAAESGRPLPLTVYSDPMGSGKNVIGYFAPSMAVIFLFIGAGLGARSIVQERAGGTLARLAAAPIRSGAVVSGKMLAILAMALTSVFALWAETALAFHASWGDAPGVAVMCAATALAMCGLSMFLTSLAKDENQAFTASVIVGFVLGILGGNFFPPGSLPPFMQTLSLATPNGWALVGFGRLSQEMLGFPSVIEPALVLLGFAAVFGVASTLRIGRVVEL